MANRVRIVPTYLDYPFAFGHKLSKIVHIPKKYLREFAKVEKKGQDIPQISNVKNIFQNNTTMKLTPTKSTTLFFIALHTGPSTQKTSHLPSRCVQYPFMWCRRWCWTRSTRSIRSRLCKTYMSKAHAREGLPERNARWTNNQMYSMPQQHNTVYFSRA